MPIPKSLTAILLNFLVYEAKEAGQPFGRIRAKRIESVQHEILWPIFREAAEHPLFQRLVRGFYVCSRSAVEGGDVLSEWPVTDDRLRPWVPRLAEAVEEGRDLTALSWNDDRELCLEFAYLLFVTYVKMGLFQVEFWGEYDPYGERMRRTYSTAAALVGAEVE